MKLSALLGHSSELLRIIRKSYQPSDFIMSDYFRKKKYIGSSERRFLSELVYSVLRGYSLFEYCMNNSISKFGNELSEEQIDNELLISVTATYLFELKSHSELVPKSNDDYQWIFRPSQLLKKFIEIDNDNFLQHITEALAEKANISKNSIEDYFHLIKITYEELDNQAQKIKENKENITPDDLQVISQRYSLPSWILESWLNNSFNRMRFDDMCNLSESLLYPAPLTIRVNLSYITREEVIDTFIKNEIDCKACMHSLSGIILKKRTQLNTLDIFKKGLIEVQDEGSQIIGYALNPEENEKILDACAGAGGKTLHIADIQKNACEIVASDVDYRKLEELIKRAKRSGFNSIRTQNLSNLEKFSLRSEKGLRFEVFDRVLVDAPCSGLGTVRRMPMQKWRLTPELLKKHSDKQLKILKYYSQFVKDGGILLYSTCSLMSEENEEVVDKFLSQNINFKPYPLEPAFDRFNIEISGLEKDSYMLRLSPDKYGCDGFFMAKMIRDD